MKKKVSLVKIIVISINETQQRIDNFLFKKLNGVPKSRIYRLLRKGEVRVNKKRIKPKYKLVTGDIIRIPPIQMTEYKKATVSPNMQKVAILSDFILYEDDYVLILNKPSGTAVHGGNRLKINIIESLRILRPKNYFLELVHRLDKDTSGALLIAKKFSTLRLLHEQLRKQKIEKTYLALVHGRWQSNTKLVQEPLLKNIQKNGEWIIQVNHKGKLSKTYFQIEERYPSTTLISCMPITGRTHQIRVHTKHVGNPIVFDSKYGNAKLDKKLTSTGLSRLFLHALTLKFYHPNTGKIIYIKAPLDEQLNRCLKFLRVNSI